MARRLSLIEVHQVKLLICEGFSQTDVSRALDISQAIVSKICLGDVHRDIPWPNREVGEKLMRERGKRADRDTAQARLISGVPQPLEPRRVEQAGEIAEMSEADAVQQAREQVAKREDMKREIERRVEEDDKEQDRIFRDSMRVKGPASDTEVKPQASIWGVPFLEWEEVVGRAGDNGIVEVAKDAGDIVQRAIGIVFLQENSEDWDSDQTLRKISVVVEQLKAKRNE